MCESLIILFPISLLYYYCCCYCNILNLSTFISLNIIHTKLKFLWFLSILLLYFPSYWVNSFIYLPSRETVTLRSATKFRTRERTRVCKVEQRREKEKRDPERMQNRARCGIRRTNYQKNYTPVNFYRSEQRWVRTKKAVRGNRAKIYIERFSWSSLARSQARLLPRMAWHSKSGAPPKLFRTIIITSRDRRAIFYSISSASSGMRRL